MITNIINEKFVIRAKKNRNVIYHGKTQNIMDVALHPEDMETTEDELKDITIKNILVDACYNDLGFTVGDKIMILTEAQTTWTMNIIIRALT